jgi:hypothetical protein
VAESLGTQDKTAVLAAVAVLTLLQALAAQTVVTAEQALMVLAQVKGQPLVRLVEHFILAAAAAGVALRIGALALQAQLVALAAVPRVETIA